MTEKEKKALYKKSGLLITLNTIFSAIFTVFDASNPFFSRLKPAFKALSGFIGKEYIFPPLIIAELALLRLEWKAFKKAENKTAAEIGKLAIATLRCMTISTAIAGGAISFLLGSAAFNLATPVMFVAALSLVGVGSLVRFASDTYFYFKHTEKPTPKGLVKAAGWSLFDTATIGAIVFSVGKLFLAPALGLGLVAAIASPVGIAAASLATAALIYRVYKSVNAKDASETSYTSTNIKDYHFSIEQRLQGLETKGKKLELLKVIKEQQTYLTKELLMKDQPKGFFAKIGRLLWLKMTSGLGLQKRWSDQFNALKTAENNLIPEADNSSSTESTLKAIEMFKPTTTEVVENHSPSNDKSSDINTAPNKETARIYKHCTRSFFSTRSVTQQVLEAYSTTHQI